MTKFKFYVVKNNTTFTPHTTDIECPQCWFALQLVYNSLLYISESGVSFTYYSLMVMLCYSGLCFVSVLLGSKKPKKYELSQTNKSRMCGGCVLLKRNKITPTQAGTSRDVINIQVNISLNQPIR